MWSTRLARVRKLLAAAKKDEDANKKPIELGSPDDFQLKQAINHLKGQPVIAKIDKGAT